MNACPNRMDPITTHLSMNQIQEVELIKGPYSMRFGPTFSCIANLISHQMTDEYGLSFQFKTNFQSNPQTFTNHIKIAYNQASWDAQAGYNYSDSKDYRDGHGTEVPSAFKTQDYFLKFAMKTMQKSRYEIGVQQQFGRNILHPTLPMDTSFDDTFIIHYIGKSKIKHPFLKELQSRVYASFIDHQMHNLKRPNAKMIRILTDVISTTIGGKLEAFWKINRLNLYQGVDWISIERDGTKNTTQLMNNGQQIPNPTTTQSSVWQNTKQTNFGNFLQGDYTWSKVNTLDFGLRVDRNELNIKDPSTLFLALYKDFNSVDYNLSGTVSYTRTIDPNHKISFLFGRGVRSGDMIEQSINQHQVGMDGANYLGNVDLKPETNHQFEIQYKKIGDKINVDFSVYQSFITNYIIAKQVNIENSGKILTLKQFQNIDNAIKVGLDMNWNYQLNPTISLSGNFNYIYTENKDWKEAIALTPPLENRLKLTISYSWSKWNIEHQYVNHQNKIANSFGEKASTSYHLLHFNSSININRDIHLTFGIDNILDTFYQSHLNFNYKNQKDLPLMQRMANPGRNFKIQFTYQF